MLQLFCLLTALFCLPVRAVALVLTEDTAWHGEVDLREDVLVPTGRTLTISPGTKINVWPATGTKVDPEYLSHRTEITVRGKIIVKGSSAEPIVFSLAGQDRAEEWAGIILDRGSAAMSFCTISDAENGLLVIDGDLLLADSLLTGNRYGLVAQGEKTTVKLTNSRVQGNDYGILALDKARILEQGNNIANNEKEDIYTGRRGRLLPGRAAFQPPAGRITRYYRNDVLLSTTIWQGRVIIEGQVRVAEDARLVILPGAVVEFTKTDSNNDGIGENGLLIQGLLIAKGSSEQPIIFRSAEKNRQRGDWDSINILGSDLAQNLIEFCQIEDAYRALHFHFANVSVNNCILLNNYRGIQFQESLVNISNNLIHDNKSGIWARDSELTFNRNQLYDNLYGARFFRIDLRARQNIIVNNTLDGLRIREGTTVLENNTLTGNRSGLLVNDAEYGKFNSNLISHNLEAGLALRDTDRIEISNNSIRANGLNGISISDSFAVISRNLISENGDRGIGASSFDGTISENNILDNGRYAIGLDGEGDVLAPMNWWGTSDLDREIYDKSDEARLGRVHYQPKRTGPVLVDWPLSLIPYQPPGPENRE